MLLPFLYWIIYRMWVDDKHHPRERYFAWNVKFYTFWIMGMILHALVFVPETIMAFGLLFEWEVMNDIYSFTAWHSMAGPFGLYWLLFALLVWAYYEPASDTTAEVPVDEEMWSDGVRTVLLLYVLTEAFMAFLQIWTMPTVTEWVALRNYHHDLGHHTDDDRIDYNSGDYIM